MNPRQALAAGRLYAVKKMPYFSTAIAALVPHEAPGLGTLAVTKDAILMFDPAAVGKWTTPQLGGVILHEVGHLLRRHHCRAEALDVKTEEQRIWNVAADACLNEDLRDGKIELPAGCVYPEVLEQPLNLAVEERFRLLQKKLEAEGGNKRGDGEGEGEGGESGEGKPDATGGWCGSAAGRPVPDEPEGTAGKGRSAADIERVRRVVAEAIRKEASKGRGTVPGGWARWADAALTPPKVDWRTELARSIRQAVSYRAGQHDLSWTRPSRRQAGIGWGPGLPVLPGTHSPVPRVAVVLDTSGSMGDAELHAGMSEMNGVLQAVGAEVEFCACDADVHSLQPVRTWQEAVGLVKGGGGTDMRPAFDALELRRPRPEVVVVVTDGCLGDGHPAEEPSWCRVVWLLVGRWHQKPCDWGTIVELECQPHTAESR
jgi:predicted metal-dependent peptidase